MALAIHVSPGDLLDRITILEIKAGRLTEPDARANVANELEALRAARDAHLAVSEELAALCATLRRVNEELWEVEDELRRHEASGDFGGGFVRLARSVYRGNDRRAAIKRSINALVGSDIVEEKSHRRTEASSDGSR